MSLAAGEMQILNQRPMAASALFPPSDAGSKEGDVAV